MFTNENLRTAVTKLKKLTTNIPMFFSETAKSDFVNVWVVEEDKTVVASANVSVDTY